MDNEKAISKLVEAIDKHTEYILAISAILIAKGIITTAEFEQAVETVRNSK